MKTKQIGTWFIFSGLLLIAAALCFTVYNIKEQNQAARAAADALQQISQHSHPEEEGHIPEYLRDPQTKMPELAINGQDYIGVVDIPALGLRLPVIGEWSYPNLKLAPCRYQGSAYLDDLIIMAHNYSSHFGAIGDLRPGDEVYFEDMNGYVFAYEVMELETLAGTETDEMTAGEWDLTLFTCTIGGQSRVTVRCQRAEN